ncbi:MAG: efflux RND transporter periplasmic adaptor subunit [Myxococcota bacterium]
MLWLALWSCAPSSDVPTVRAERGDLDVHLEFKGELEARDSVKIVNPIDGWSEIEFIIDDGTRVKAGDEVVRFTTEELQKNLVEARARLDVAHTRRDQARAKLQLSLGEARARVVQAELDAELAALSQTDSLTVPRVDREQSVVEALRAGITTGSASTRLEQVELDAKAEIQLLEIDALLAERKIASLEKILADSVLTAPSDGLALLQKRWGRETFRVGHEVYTGSTLIELPDIETLDVVAWVHEVDSPLVRVGQRATITMDAHPDTQVAATVTQVAPLVVPRGDHGVKHLRVELEPDATTEKMKPGLTLQVDVVVNEVRDAVLLPKEAVFTGLSGAFVYGADGEPLPVTVLAEDKTTLAVDGLESGTYVLTFDPAAWARGERPPEDPT